MGDRWLNLTPTYLGEGNFGMVIKGELKEENRSIPVAVKMLKGNSHVLKTIHIAKASTFHHIIIALLTISRMWGEQKWKLIFCPSQSPTHGAEDHPM